MNVIRYAHTSQQFLNRKKKKGLVSAPIRIAGASNTGSPCIALATVTTTSGSQYSIYSMTT